MSVLVIFEHYAARLESSAVNAIEVALQACAPPILYHDDQLVGSGMLINTVRRSRYRTCPGRSSTQRTLLGFITIKRPSAASMGPVAWVHGTLTV